MVDTDHAARSRASAQLRMDFDRGMIAVEPTPVAARSWTTERTEWSTIVVATNATTLSRMPIIVNIAMVVIFLKVSGVGSLARCGASTTRTWRPASLLDCSTFNLAVSIRS